ncbi:DUF4190 domain-containing protein [Nocardia sp. NBC_00511]|uniref:DUF4190 domain-containing protein n=1 Tax=Nocardia sp. NBC_00511 TaxID=2903591 RepID=UPI0030E17B4C
MFDPYSGMPLAGPGMWKPPQHGPIEHPNAALVLTLGVLGLFCCGVCAPIAWVSGLRALREIDASGGAFGGRHQVVIGMVLGILGTIVLIFGGIVFGLMAIGGH